MASAGRRPLPGQEAERVEYRGVDEAFLSGGEKLTQVGTEL